MNKTYVAFILAITIILTSGCAGRILTKGQQFSHDNVKNIELQKTTNKDTASMFGKPNKKKIKTLGGIEYDIHKYSFIKVDPISSHSKFLYIEYSKEIINGYSYENNFLNESTNFAEEKRNQLIKNKSNKNDVISILGNPSGKVHIPSTLIGGFFKREGVNAALGATDAWFYQNFLLDRLEPSKKTVKKLALFFDENGIIINNVFIHERH